MNDDDKEKYFKKQNEIILKEYNDLIKRSGDCFIFMNQLDDWINYQVRGVEENIKIKTNQAKVNNLSEVTRDDVDLILDSVFYWQGYRDALVILKKFLDLKNE